eukprot:4673125-Amphidinium_carterae.2
MKGSETTNHHEPLNCKGELYDGLGRAQLTLVHSNSQYSSIVKTQCSLRLRPPRHTVVATDPEHNEIHEVERRTKEYTDVQHTPQSSIRTAACCW